MSCGAYGCDQEPTDILEVVIPPEEIPAGMEEFDRSVEYCSGCATLALRNATLGIERGHVPAFRWLRKVDWDVKGD